MSAKLTIKEKPFVSRDQSCPPGTEHPSPTEFARADRTAGAAQSKCHMAFDNSRRKPQL
jgi:hypothetical protein